MYLIGGLVKKCNMYVQKNEGVYLYIEQEKLSIHFICLHIFIFYVLNAFICLGNIITEFPVREYNK